jgi:hypothetical protein
MAGRGGDERGESPRIGRVKSPPSAPGSTVPGTEKPQVERRKATRAFAQRAPVEARKGGGGDQWWRLAALHALALCAGERAKPGAVSARGNDRACLIPPLKGEG